MAQETEPLTMKKLEKDLIRLDERVTAIDVALDGRDPLLREIERLSIAEEEANRRRKTMNAMNVTRIVLEMILAIAIIAFSVGCNLELPGQSIENEKLAGTIWICSPTLMDDMNVVRIVFDESGKDGSVIFATHNTEREKKFSLVGNEMHFRSPEGKWDFTTDYDSILTVDSGDIETDFIRFRSELDGIQ